MDPAAAVMLSVRTPPRTSTRELCLLFVLRAGREVHPAEVARATGRSLEVVAPALTELKTQGLIRMRVGAHPEVRGPGALLYRAPAVSVPTEHAAGRPLELPRARRVVEVTHDRPGSLDGPREIARRAVATAGTTKLTEVVYAIVRAASAPISLSEIRALLPDGYRPASVAPTLSKLIELERIAAVPGSTPRARHYCIAGHPATRRPLDIAAAQPAAVTTPGRARWRDRRVAGAPQPGPRPIALVDLVYGVIAGARSPLSVLEITDLMPPGVGATSVSPTVSKLVGMGRILPVRGDATERFRRFTVCGTATTMSVRTARARRRASHEPPVQPPAGGDVEAAVVNTVRILGPVSEAQLRTLLRGEYRLRDLRIRLDKLVAENTLTPVTTPSGPAYALGRAIRG